MVTHNLFRISIAFHPCTGSRSLKKLALDLDFYQDGEGHHAGPGAERKNWRYITVVRNHWEAMGSWWFKQQGQSPEASMSKEWFETWLKMHPNYHKAGRLWWFLEEIPDIEVVYFEDMENAIRQIFREYGMEFDAFPFENKGVYREGRETKYVMEEGCFQRIGNEFGEEIRELGYVPFHT